MGDIDTERVEHASGLVFEAARAYCEEGEIPLNAVLVVVMSDSEGRQRLTYCASNDVGHFTLLGMGYGFLECLAEYEDM